jgi:alkanesulfonate monooxygenase
MPIDIRGRIPFNGKQPLSNTAAGRYGAFFIQAPGPATADPSVIVQAAREQEALGYDSSLIPQSSSRPDVWACTGWALAATQHLKLVAAHRIGWQQPTLAARTLATLDRLSNGRQYVHVLQGRTEIDQRRDGDFLDKSQRYARSHEYLDIFIRTLTATEPFSYSGEFYSVKDAFSNLKPVQTPYPLLHFPGGSPAGLDLVAKYADAWAVAGQSVDEVARGISQLRQLASERYGRPIERFWSGGFNVILAPTDELAWQKAESIAIEVERFIVDGRAPQRPLTEAERLAAGADDRPGQALYLRLARLTGHGPSLVGSPESVADAVLAYYQAGVTTLTLGGICEYFAYDGSDLITAEDRLLLRHLITLVRQRVAAADAARAQPQAISR